MAEKIIQIVLKPQGFFFFGGEKRFSGNDGEVNYFAASTFFPQQSGLLGLLRQLILEKNGLIPLDSEAKKTQAAKLIGTNSFMPSKKETTDFGAIKLLSPIFLAKKGQPLMPKARAFSANQPVIYSTIKGVCAINGLEKNQVPLLSNTSYYKDGFDKGWIGKKPDEFYTEEEVFKFSTRDGIIKSRNDNDKEAYYKQTFLSLKTDFSFIFFAKIEETEIPKSQTITLGGERSTFKMIVTESPSEDPFSDWDKFVEPYYHPTIEHNHKGKIVIVSPTLPSENFMETLDFAMLDFCDFRNLESNLHTENFTNVGKDKQKGAVRSTKYQLLASGSVLFPQKMKELEKALQKEKYFHQIGYNYYFKTN
jgi:CRISPR-associated protein Cmr3